MSNDAAPPANWFDWTQCMRWLSDLYDVAEMATRLEASDTTIKAHLNGSSEPRAENRRAYVEWAHEERGRLSGIEAAGYQAHLRQSMPAPPPPQDIDEDGDPIEREAPKDKVAEKLAKLKRERSA